MPQGSSVVRPTNGLYLLSDDMGYMCCIPVSCMNSCDICVEIFKNCEIITVSLPTACLMAVKVHGLNWHFEIVFKKVGVNCYE